MDKYFYFDDIFQDYTKYSLKISKNLYLKSGLYPIIDQGKEEIAGYSDKNINIFDKIPVIIFGDHTRIFKYVDYPFFSGADGVKILKNTSSLFLDKYLYYSLKNFKIPNTGYNRHFKWLKDFKIKYISLAKQKRITSLIEKIEFFILKKEKQLEYLKELKKSLFTRMFGDIRSNSKNFEIKNLDSIYYIRSSKRVFEKDYKKEGVPFFRSKEIVELSNSKNIIPEIYISFDKYEELKKVSGIPLKGDLLITAVGTIGKIWKVNYEKDFYFKDGNLIWLQLKNKNNFNSLSLKRILEDSIKNEKENLTSGSAYNALTIDKLKKIDIIIPPMELQNKFAERIEKIEKLSFNFYWIYEKERSWEQLKY